MQKRKIVIGEYDTATHGWTLAGWKLSDAKQKTNYVEKLGGDGSWDLSTVLTDGIPRYADRDLTITLECSEGTRMERETKIRNMINLLDGLPWQIKLPDDDLHHVVGRRVHVVREYNDLAHAAVTVTAICEPWKYADAEKIVTLTAATSKQTAQLVNDGRRAVVPTLKVTGASASVLLEYGTASLALGAVTRQWPDLLLTTGAHALTYSGTGTITVTYREAVLE